MSDWPFEPIDINTLSQDEMRLSWQEFLRTISRRRSVREFSDRPVPAGIIRTAIQAAGSAPSGANMQPWHFVAVSNPGLKTRMRAAAEQEERELYGHRASDEWLKALEPLGTNADKPFMETAPWLITDFLKKFTFDDKGNRYKNYYTTESVGIACGFLLAALHWSGLATLTHTPSPMKFLGDILERPPTERAYMVIVAGYPAEDARVPVIGKQPIGRISTFLE